MQIKYWTTGGIVIGGLTYYTIVKGILNYIDGNNNYMLLDARNYEYKFYKLRGIDITPGLILGGITGIIIGYIENKIKKI
jgi:hypothetical protein